MAHPPNYQNDAVDLHNYILSHYDESQLAKNPTAILDAIEDYATNVKRLMIFSQAKLEATEQILAKLDPKPQTLVELGGYVGKSALGWGVMLRKFHNLALPTQTAPPSQLPQQQVGAPAPVRVYSMEVEPSFCAIIQSFIDLAGPEISSTVRVVAGSSADSLRKLKASMAAHVDVLFLDHWKEFYLSDLRLCEELGLLRRGSVVVADNTDFPGAPDYLAYVEAGGEGGWKYRCEKVVVQGGPGPSVVHFAYVEETP